MYIWIGCKLPEDFEKELRSLCLSLNEDIGLSTDPFTLPQHISLKISFEAGEKQGEILAWLSTVLSQEDGFYVNLNPAERMGNILWMPVAENPRLQALHQMLDRELETRFGIPQHPFDRCFRFHSTLFMDPDQEKLQQMHERLKGISFDCPLAVDTFLLGISPDGTGGSYRVIEEIKEVKIL